MLKLCLVKRGILRSDRLRAARNGEITMKKILALLLAMALSLSACGDGASTGQGGELSGGVTALGSTSMERVMGVLAEQFGIDHDGVMVSVEGGGSGAGVEAAAVVPLSWLMLWRHYLPQSIWTAALRQPPV